MLVLNHFYKLKHDTKRTYIIGPERNSVEKFGARPGWRSTIHPIYAMVLSFFSKPVEEQEAIKDVASFLRIGEDKVKDLIQRLDSKEPVMIDFDNTVSAFPPNLLLSAPEEIKEMPVVEYSPEQFVYKEVDLRRHRPFSSPFGVVFMINNTCATNCLYCYADKTVAHPTMPWNMVEKIVTDAKRNNIDSFDITGGEIFIYKDWPKFLDLLAENGYKPDLLSTKVPLTEEQIKQFKKYGIQLQISLDSFDADILSTVLNVRPDYRDKIVHTIDLLEQYGIKYQIATVITKYNESLDSLKGLYEFLNSKKMITRWEIRLAFRSLYSRCDFDKIKVTEEQIGVIDDWVTNVLHKRLQNCNILWVKENNREYFKCSTGSRDFPGSRCSANYSHMVILPDGKVTICEQLYWKPKYIIGDVTKDSIPDIWNSDKALKLAFRDKSELRDKSVCKTCKLWDECEQYPNRCIADILKGYGEENSDYPDPRCSFAPPFVNVM